MADQGGPVRIGIDGFNLAMRRGTGVATYARTLSRCLHGLGHPVDAIYGMSIGARAPAALREVLFFDGLDQDAARPPPAPLTPRWLRELASAPRGLDAVPVPITGRVVAQAFAGRLPHQDRVLNAPDLFGVAERHFRRHGRFLRLRVPDPPAVMHWTYPLPIRLQGARNIYTIHDLVPLRLPYTTLDNKRFYFRLIRGCLRWGDHVCTVSDASRRDIQDLFGAPDDRVTNTYQAFVPPASALAQSDAQVAEGVRGLFGLEPGGYFLFFGAIEPKKNLGRLIEAHLTSGLATPLVIVGARAWRSEGELQLVRPWGADAGPTRPQAVRQLDYLPVALLMTLVRGARAVVFPSLYEGFGLPVLEAMSLGTPVLTSTEGAVPEVAGDAALLVNPYDPAAIADGLRRLDADGDLRAELAARGRRQAERFSMARYQARVAAMYADVLAAPTGRPVLAAAGSGRDWDRRRTA